jgi:dihydroneopterin aldolase
MDKILIRNLKIYAHHGVLDEEKANGQYFIFDIDAFVDISVPCKTDNVGDTVNYALMVERITEIFTSQKDDLVERAAQRVADGLFAEFERISALRILLKKPDAPIDADFDWVGVEINRKREEFINE